ncbi:MAG TPA: hypothetical protein VHO70_00940 [Chitinispirillaceae bacterium]|nr:hypothetical protein [Chitinispirillaceae bacterium]
MMTLFFTDKKEVLSWDDAKHCDTKRYGKYFHELLEHGVYLPPSQFEAWFISSAHGESELDTAIAKSEVALRSIKKELQ